MLVACRLAGLSALEGHYAGLNALPQLSPCGEGGDVGLANLAAGRRCVDRKGRNFPFWALGGLCLPADPKTAVLPIHRVMFRAGFRGSDCSDAPRWAAWVTRPKPTSGATPGGPLVGPRPTRLERVLTRSLGQSSIPSLGDGVMLGKAWIDRPVDTQGCAPCFHVLLSAAWKRGHAQANDRHSSRVFAMPPRGFARTTRNG